MSYRMEYGKPRKSSCLALLHGRFCPSQIGGRFLIGIGVGLASCIAPLYIQELSPTRLRGRMVVLNVVMITLGQVIAYGIDAGFANVNSGWRWMVGLSAVPAALQLAVLAFLPESRERSSTVVNYVDRADAWTWTFWG